jgi:hypothetical protein
VIAINNRDLMLSWKYVQAVSTYMPIFAMYKETGNGMMALPDFHNHLRRISRIFIRLVLSLRPLEMIQHLHFLFIISHHPQNEYDFEVLRLKLASPKKKKSSEIMYDRRQSKKKKKHVLLRKLHCRL